MAKIDYTPLTLDKLESIDTIEVLTGPEKKGLFFKYVEYVVRSKRYGTEVNRRYNDFVALYELLLTRFPYRLIPKLPPKKMFEALSGDLSFLETRRKGLQVWLTLVTRHPIISEDAILCFFLSQNIPDLHLKLKEIFNSVPDEFSTSELSATIKESDATNNKFAACREQIRYFHNAVQAIEIVVNKNPSLTSQDYTCDIECLSDGLAQFTNQKLAATDWGTENNWGKIRNGLDAVAKNLSAHVLKLKETSQNEKESSEKLSMLMQILTGHLDLCERVEKGVSYEHKTAHSKMVALKKRKIQGVLQGSDAESVAVLENRMLQQENLIASIELRTAFSFYCVEMETTLVYCYMETLGSILNCLVKEKIECHSNFAQIWKLMEPIVQHCLPNHPDVT